ncbi:Hypothetical protein CINCED_3A001538 [Cinara cedri]|uniref:Uncharacterized protein n=1 Tax=Cinara cedri TaxID=506608 RepID=A0A5E4N178_9HEMI|nr:Hypothetical protein CINCED_3A001538 [Cinara cedri]
MSNNKLYLTSTSKSLKQNDKNPKLSVLQIATPSFRWIKAVGREQKLRDPHSVIPLQGPRYINNITNFSSFQKTLLSLTGINSFSHKAAQSFLIVYPNDQHNFSLFIELLNNTDLEFHKYCAHHATLFGSLSGICTIPHPESKSLIH